MTSTIKVNNIQNQCGQNIINENSNTITLGASGDTIALASGASQTGFGRTGTVDWQTGSIKTSTFTAANGEGYFVDTSSSAFTMNLPAGSAGAIVSVADYASSFNTHNLTIAADGSDKIGGSALDVILQTEGQSATLVFVDATKGWVTVNDSTENLEGSTFLVASGGTITNSGNCRIHTFTGPGTFTVSSLASTPAQNEISYVIVAGGGGGGSACAGGGGGAGGFREVKSPVTPYTASPLDGYGTPGNRVTVTAQGYPIVVGAGGAGAPGYVNPGTNGNNSSGFSITSAAGGGGGGSPNIGADGGSGGGGAHGSGAGGSGNTPPVSPAQGKDGAASAPGTGSAPSDAGGGGGGATTAGVPGPSGPGPTNHQGGTGATTSITASPVAYAGGGGGTNRDGGGSSDTDGGAGGGGKGGYGPRPTPAPQATGQAGTANTGGGGGGGKPQPSPSAGGAGGSGIVIIRYKFQ